MSLLTPEELAVLSRIDSPTVANVIELFDIRPRVAGYTNATIRAVYPELPPVAGYAVTATFRSAYPAETGDSYGGMAQLISDAQSTPAPRIILFQDLDEPCRAATYGEVMATTFQTFGFVGLITSGAGRDIDQVRRLRFPCWASSMIVSHGYCRFVESNLPVVVGGLQVRPGDLLHADGNGVLSIPHGIAGTVTRLCEPFVNVEQIVLDYLKSPQPTLDGYKTALERMKAAAELLREQAHAHFRGQ
jgi:regulator of RNase E activity RraA